MRRLALLALLGALAAGCGGEETVMPTAEEVVGEQPQAQPQPQAQGDPQAGRQVFLDSGCGGCHVFTPAGPNARGTTGPNLDNLPQFAEKAGQPLEEFTRESLVNPDAYVEEGFPEGVMPEFTGDDQQLANLVAFLTQG
ncbi:MAG TPA: cytochrome c [Gaiellaceae bacterium]|nr:cytochrome c [Gaiellaceae bacterium]